MCRTTKDLIVLALRKLMQDKPLRKIKVQDIMQITGMTRQSFYYHFQDIYQVLEWEVNRKLIQPNLYREGEGVEAWLTSIIQNIESDHDFYRRVVKNVEIDQLYRVLFPVVHPVLLDRLFGEIHPDLDLLDTESVQAAEFFTYSTLYLIVDFAACKDSFTESGYDLKFHTLKMVVDATSKEIDARRAEQG